jgi:molecular chaperone HtpG
MAVFGKNILENLTTGMYQNSRVMFREYVQNACDAIDAAIKSGILSSRSEARIDVTIDSRKRDIAVTDNGSGIPKDDFIRVLTDIANSDKQRDSDKGFRGIGRLCGLAYCTELKFVSSAKGEESASVLMWDAVKMRRMLEDKKKWSADEVLEETVKSDSTPEDADKHYFTVYLLGIKEEDNESMDTAFIRDYLSFEAPVPYTSSFMFGDKIYKHAESQGLTIDEYPIYVEGEQIFKNYNSIIYSAGKRHDSVRDIEFKEFYDKNEHLIAWMWFGISSLNGQIKPENVQRGLRLRKGNIQIGSAQALREQGLFPDGRANEYFIGEVFAVHPDLIPNARRDYFNGNPMRVIFENSLKDFFKYLWKLCNVASDDRSDYRAIKAYHVAVETYHEKESSGFSGTVDRETLEDDLEKKKKAAEKAQRRLEKTSILEKPPADYSERVTNTVKQIVRNTESDIEPQTPLPSLPQEIFQNGDDDSPRKPRPKYLTEDLAQYDKRTRTVVAQIYDLINQHAPDIAGDLISRIHTSLKSKGE